MANASNNRFHLIVPDKAQSAEVKLGSDVTVSCHLTPEISAADMEIRWFKETDCVCLYKNRQLTEGRKYVGRTGLSTEELNRGNVSLKLRDFQESDIGVYLCQVISEDTTQEITVEVGGKEDSGVPPVSHPSKIQGGQVLKLHELDRTWGDTQRMKMEESALMTEEVKVFTFFTGNNNTLHEVHKNLIGTLRNHIPNLREVKTVDESDFALILCLLVSRAGTDIDAALKQFEGNTGSKLAVLVVLHPTIDPEKTVLDSSKYVNTTDILTVDYLFNEDTGLLKCQRNSDADNKVKNWLKQVFNKVDSKMTQKYQGQGESQKSKKDKSEPKSVQTIMQRKTKEVKVFTFYTGHKNTLHEVHKNLIGTLQNHIPNLREVKTVDESDFALILCLLVSRAGTDIDAALKQFEGNTGSKLAILVVLHPTIDPEKTVLESSKYVNRTDILTVDYLFNEDTGLLKCQRNSDADVKVKNWLIQQEFNKMIYENREKTLKCQGQEKPHKSEKDESESETVQTKRPKRADDKPKTKGVKVFVTLAGKADQCHEEFIAILKNRIENLSVVHTVDETDIILVFCPIVSRVGSDIEAALKCCTDSVHTQKLTVLVVLHHTFDPDKVVLDSSKFVNRTDILTVDYLFYEDTGLLKCQKNSDADDKVVNWLRQQEKKLEASRESMNLQVSTEQESDVILLFCPDISGCHMRTDTEHPSPPVSPVFTSSHTVRYFTNLTKDAKNFLRCIDATENQICLNEVTSVEDSDVILLFCPDISDCNKRTDKPVVLIFLHKTVSSDSVPSSNEFVNKRRILPLDLVYVEGEELPNCKINRYELSAFLEFLSAKIIKEK
ncbi:hypothetical protein ROHU_018035 [Labeo rohita]|uniref:Ig-like domain-containing protein n=1 Tax=Labeo rohita TaxID=84645 RepID=A0A498NAA0_LABRO|nr:hypothetical protein ROHU_028965 [Labeo rohita]RXN29981.1 hypothetical protein ROHU_018035 [Labeo rohita]